MGPCGRLFDGADQESAAKMAKLFAPDSQVLPMEKRKASLALGVFLKQPCHDIFRVAEGRELEPVNGVGKGDQLSPGGLIRHAKRPSDRQA